MQYFKGILDLLNVFQHQPRTYFVSEKDMSYIRWIDQIHFSEGLIIIFKRTQARSTHAFRVVTVSTQAPFGHVFLHSAYVLGQDQLEEQNFTSVFTVCEESDAFTT